VTTSLSLVVVALTFIRDIPSRLSAKISVVGAILLSLMYVPHQLLRYLKDDADVYLRSSSIASIIRMASVMHTRDNDEWNR
jgi:hypothetical protein